MKNHTHTALGLILLFGGLAACTPSGPASGGGTSAPAPADVSPPAEPASDPAAAEPAPVAAPAPLEVAEHTLGAELSDKWKPWATKRTAAIVVDHPELKQKVASLSVERGRDGRPRMNANWLSDANVGPLLLGRLLDADGLDMRVGLAGALAKSTGIPTEALVDLAVGANDSDVRRVVVAQLWRHDEDTTREALATALDDDHVEVRVAAATASSRHPRGRALASSLETALTDEAPEVRWVAARALSAVGEPSQVVRLEPLLDDAHPRVRRVALRAIDRLDPDRAKALVTSKKLTEDDDAKVARAAASIANR